MVPNTMPTKAPLLKADLGEVAITVTLVKTVRIKKRKEIKTIEYALPI